MSLLISFYCMNNGVWVFLVYQVHFLCNYHILAYHCTMKELVKEWSAVIITDRELAIVKALSEGNTSGEAAYKLRMNRRTLEAAIVRLKDKTGCRTVAHLACKFIRNKLID